MEQSLLLADDMAPQPYTYLADDKLEIRVPMKDRVLMARMRIFPNFGGQGL